MKMVGGNFVIAMLRGQLVHAKEDYIVLEVNGVGYKVFVPAVPANAAGQQVLHTYLHVREDALVLFGFPQQEQLELFELLISVSGMGPKGALGVLAYLDPARIRQAVAMEDLAALTKIPGIGKKTAQRLVLELRDKLKVKTMEEQETFTRNEGPLDEALEALVALGYAPADARNALNKGLKDFTGDKSLESVIKLALKHIR